MRLHHAVARRYRGLHARQGQRIQLDLIHSLKATAVPLAAVPPGLLLASGSDFNFVVWQPFRAFLGPAVLDQIILF